ncbi:RNA polymerase sigma-70 factor (ECF subfamily) [Rhizobium sp. PP-F2F-G48]|nr:RNA polymerase sigma-70 factor (ECF subfamily) [Rhizobium sp. PP-F2F-G48]
MFYHYRILGSEALKAGMTGDARQHFAGLADAVAKKRDQAAFAELFHFFAPRLKSFLLRQNTPANEAEEIVQEVMIVLWHKADLYDAEKSSLSTWLFRIARNRRIDAARRQLTRKLDEKDPLLLPSAPPAPDEFVQSGDREDVVRTALAKLPSEQVKLIQLAFFFGQSHSEIAASTGLPLGTVKSRIRLAFGKLRTLLHDDGIDGSE